MNRARRDRRKAARAAAGKTHEHIPGTRCTVCQPLPGSVVNREGGALLASSQLPRQFPGLLSGKLPYGTRWGTAPRRHGR